MKIIAVIPARLASTRFPRKVLFSFHGLPMVEHVRRRALLSNAVSDVYVATCDEEVADVIREFGGKVIMTADTHINGTDRVAEAIRNVECSHVLLLQGDEPLLLPRHMGAFAEAIASDPNGDAWNATGPIEEEDELDRRSFVKCVVSSSGRILYCFRRTPYYSDFAVQRTFVRKMFGLIAYRKEFLLRLTSLPASPVECAESIEQLRIVDNAYRLSSIDVSPSLPSINEPHEADIVLDYLRDSVEQQALLKVITS